MKRRFPYKAIAIHALFWLLYVALEYLANVYHIRAEQRLFFLWTTLASLPVLILPTYFIVWVAVPKFLKKGQWVAFLVVVTVVGVLVGIGRIRLYEWMHFMELDHFIRMPLSKVWKNIIRDYSFIGLAICIHIIGDWRKKQQANEALIRAKADAEMRLLKAQLHPHFLFNTLNNLYSLALAQSDQTAESILKLTELLDYLVYWANKDQVPLSKEVQLMHNYLDLERLRYGEELQVETEIFLQNDSVLVSPLLLLPFLENCFKHGSRGADRMFWIHIFLQVDEQLVFHIENSKRVQSQPSLQNGGVGLQNIRQRLDLIYPGQHSLLIEESPERFSVHLTLQLTHG